MNRISRMLMVSGLGLATTLSLGIGPAHASPAITLATSPAATSVDRHDDDDWEFKNWYEDEDDCRDAGRRGERRDWWEDYYCKRVRHHGDRYYALWVQEDDDHHGDDRRGRD